MAQETLKLVITADTAEALANLQTFIKANKGLKEEMQKIGPVSNQATNALSNLSRVAQDAPYGFIGIANNLNPLLESFQRLSVGAKDAGTSLTKELGKALTGPAGIGLALGVVSSLLIKFGDDINAFITKQLSGLGKAFYLETDIVNKAGESFIKASTDITKLKDSFEDFQNGLITKDKFLKQFNTTLGDTIAKTDDLAVAEKFLTDYADVYVQMTFKKAVANEAAAQAAKKQFEAEVAKNKPQAAFKEAFDFTTVFYGGTIESVKDVSKARQNTVVKEAEKDVSIFETIRKKYDAEADKLQQSLAKIFGPSNGSANIGNTEQSDLQIMAKLELEATDRWVAKLKKKLKESQDVLKNERIKLFTTPSEQMQEDDKRSKYFDKRTKNLLEESDKSGFGAKMQGIFKKDKNQIDAEDAEKKRLDELTQSYARFAETLSGTVTNALFDVYDAMQQGQNPLEAMANMFAQIARNIAAAVIQALILEKLMNAFPALKGAFTALGLVGKAFGGVQAAGAIQGGVANSSSFNAGSIATNNATQGQFVLKGSDLVLATQRANNNLNIRRGY
jgi:hypothetical protein